MAAFKIIVTTSDRYHHVLPVFFFLFNKFWGKDFKVELVGYRVPEVSLPDNFNFVSLGNQSNKIDDWSTDLRKYFESAPDYFIWSMEDTFIKEPVNLNSFDLLEKLVQDKTIGRIALSDYSFNQYTNLYSIIDGVKVWRTNELSKYNLSTQIALWNKDYLLRYLKNNLSPWEFESQRKHIDGFKNICLDQNHHPVVHNEGVRITDIYKMNFSGFDQKVIDELKPFI